MSNSDIKRTFEQLLFRLPHIKSFSDFYKFLDSWDSISTQIIAESANDPYRFSLAIALHGQKLESFVKPKFIELQTQWQLTADPPALISPAKFIALFDGESNDKLLAALDESMPFRLKQYYLQNKLSCVVFDIACTTLHNALSPTRGIACASGLFRSAFLEPSHFSEMTLDQLAMCKRFVEGYDHDVRNVVFNICKREVVPILMGFAVDYSYVVAGIAFAEALRSLSSNQFKLAGAELRRIVSMCDYADEQPPKELVKLDSQASLVGLVRFLAKRGVRLDPIRGNLRKGMYTFSINNKEYFICLPFEEALLIPKSPITADIVNSAFIQLESDVFLAIVSNIDVVPRSYFVFRLIQSINACNELQLHASIESTIHSIYPELELTAIKSISERIALELPEYVDYAIQYSILKFVVNVLVCSKMDYRDAIASGVVAALARYYLNKKRRDSANG